MVLITLLSFITASVLMMLCIMAPLLIMTVFTMMVAIAVVMITILASMKSSHNGAQDSEGVEATLLGLASGIMHEAVCFGLPQASASEGRAVAV